MTELQPQPSPAEIEAIAPAFVRPDEAAPPKPEEKGLPSQEEAEKILNERSPRERVASYLLAGQELVKVQYDNGLFNEGDKIGLKEAAEWAQLYDGSEVNTDSSRAHKSLLDTLDVLPGSAAKDIRLELAGFTKLKAGDKLYTLEELASMETKEREALETQGLYGFVISQETGSASSQESITKFPEDLVIETQIASIEQQIKQAKAESKNTAAQESLLATLKLAKEANGEIGVLLKVRALQVLKEASVNAEGIETLIKGMDGKVKEAQDTLNNYLKGAGLSDTEINGLNGLIGKVGLDKLITSGKLSSLEGLDKLIFGKEMSEGQLNQLISTVGLTEEEKKSYLANYGKKLGIAALIMAIIAGSMVSVLAKNFSQ